MLACHSCIDMYQLPTGADIECGRDRLCVAGDPLWSSLRTAARIEADREPVLRRQIEEFVLGRDSLADALAKVLSQKLGDDLSSSDQLYREFSDLVGEDRSISKSVRRDLQAIGEKDPAVGSLLHPLLNYKGFLALGAYRIAHAYWAANRRSMAYHIQSQASERFGVDIHPAARIGAGLFIDHASGVVIGETAVVGNDVTILHGVTLGSTGKQRGDRHPKVGDGVFIGATAQLLGNIQIGDGSSIGAGSVVLSSVEAHSTVAGVPARVVRRSPRPTIPITERNVARA
jgi:serine O-acetyltransferase